MKKTNLTKFALIWLILTNFVFSTALGAAPAQFLEGLLSKGPILVGAIGTPDSKAVLELRSTTKGFLPPRMTTTQRDAITSPPTGLVIFNTTTSTLNQYTGVAWTAIGGGGSGGAQYNLLPNYNFEDSASYATGWTASGGTLAAAAGANILFDTKSATWDSSAAAQTFSYSAITVPEGYKGNYCEAAIYLATPSGTATHLLQAYDGTNVLRSVAVISSVTAKETTTGPFPCPTTGTITLRLVAVNANEPLVAIDNAYLGITRAVSSVAQPSFVGSLRTTGCSSVWTSATTVFTSFSAISGCTYTATGDVLAPSTMIPGFRIQNAGAGRYLILARGIFGKNVSTTNADATFRFTDSSTTFSEQISIGTGSASGLYGFTGNLSGAITYTNAPGTVSIQLQGKVTTNTSSTAAYVSDSQSSNGTGVVDGLYFDVYYFPLASQTVVSAQQQRMPNIVPLTGSGSYTPTPGTTYIEVEAIGSGGGGAASGTGSWGTATDGSATTFGSSLITAGGGTKGTTPTGGSSPGGAGGSFTINSPAIDIGSCIGSQGSYGTYTGVSNSANIAGGNGGSNCVGAGSIGTYFTGSSANNGGGGAGGGVTGTGVQYSGGGGGGGAVARARILNPSGSYSFSVAALAAGGTLGTAGAAGGSSAAGRLIVKEYFGYTTALIANSVSTGNVSGERMERARLNCNGSSTIGSQSGSWLTSITNLSGGACTLAWPSTTWSAAPSCTATVTSCSASSGSNCFVAMTALPPSTTGTTLSCLSDAGSACTAAGFDLICMGPR